MSRSASALASVRRRISIIVVLALVATLVVFITRAEGNIIPEPDLHDAGIWVSNEGAGVVGRTNTEIKTVDTRLDAASTDFDLLQSGALVLVRQHAPASALIAIDPASSVVIPGPDLPENAQIGLGGAAAASFDPESGELRVVSAATSSAALTIDPTGSVDPTSVIDGPGALAVGTDGVAHLVEIESGEITSWTAAGTSAGSASVPGDLERVSVSVVGTRPVVLSGGDTLHIPGRGPIELGGEGWVLQEPGPASDAVLVANASTLVRVSLTGGSPVEVFDGGTGKPVPPVRIAGCDYGAWSAEPHWVQDCGGDPIDGAVEEMSAGSELRFRTNRGRVTLNDIANGTQLVFDLDDPDFIDNLWNEALSDEVDTESDEESEDKTVDPCEVASNAAPVANDDLDGFGTREGRPVIVHPLRNDVDPDCDVLLITSVDPAVADSGSVGIVDGGRAVQVSVDPGVDVYRFDYRVDDGHGESDTATVAVRVIPNDQNSLPVLPQEETTVVQGGTITHNVLSNVVDPDGDVMRLTSASVPDPTVGTVRSTARGDVTFSASNTVGVAEVEFVVDDGRGDEGQTGILSVNVVPRDRQPPTARNDSISTFVGREVVVDVLDNDTDPNDDPLQIVRAVTEEDAVVRSESTSPEIRVASDTVGTVNVQYTITDGTDNDSAVLRVDFLEPPEPQPPIAVRDEVLLSAGIPAFVPVLDNDVDPEGEVLVVLGVSDLPEPPPISVTILRRSVLRITTATPLEAPVEFSYRISDGVDTADGRVLVEPSPEQLENRPPVAVTDEYSVRAGGIVVLPVLTNDSDPDGDLISVVAPAEVQPDAATDGRLFLSQDQLRYEAPRTPRGTIRLLYDVADSAGNVATGELILHVLPDDGTQNSPPIAPGLLGRTVAGQLVKIPVPITTMDPDGDAVTLLGLGTAPEFGSVVEVGPDFLSYIPDARASGTDEFTYRVVDQFGAEATGTVLVGIAEASRSNNPPIPGDDFGAVRPGSTVVIPVLANDFDPDGDDLAISEEPEDEPRPSQGSAEIDGSRIRYTAPDDPEGATTTFRYTASDGRGGTRSATVELTFRTDSENRPPVAIDDAITPQVPGTVVRIKTLDNDEDPDQDALTIAEVSLPDAVLSVDGQTVEFTMPAGAVQFTYLASDGTATARAAVFVPVVEDGENLPPIARFDDDLVVAAGGEIAVDVLANDGDPEGADLELIQVLGVRNGSAEIKDGKVVFSADQARYVGDAGFSYVVADDDDLSTAKTSIGSARLYIEGDGNTAPTFTELAVEVPQGGERRVDLTASVVDPDRDDRHRFSELDGEEDGVDASLDDAQLVVSVDRQTPAGTAVPLTLSVSDGADTVEGTVLVTVVSSDQPLAVVAPDTGETLQEVPVTIDVLANDVNPFPDVPLEIVAVSAVDGAGSADVGDGGIVFTPAAGGFGVARFTYTVADDTGAVDRQVTGTVTVTVKGRPSTPPAPTCIGGESQVVRVQWSTPSANGAPITGYVLRVGGSGAGTGDRELGTATTSDVGGLANGGEYTFSVGAINEAVTNPGQIAFSAPSPVCIPDEVPEQAPTPVTEFGDGLLTVRWGEPVSNGTPITGLTLTNTTTGVSRPVGPTDRSYVWDGLENGTTYRFTLRSANNLGDGPPSGLSTGDPVPAGVPQNPSTPTADPVIGARDGFLDVRWTWSPKNQDNGDGVQAYRVTPYRNGVAQAPKVINDGSVRRTTFDTDNGVPYRFTLEAMNKAGWSAASPQSAAAVSAAKPSPIGAVQASEGDRRSVLTFTAPADNGAAIARYEYSTNGGGWKALANNRAVTGLDNGTDYQFRVRAVNSDGAGAASPRSNTVKPYGSPTTPDVSRSVNDRTINWTWTNSSGNGRGIDRYQYSLDGGGWQDTQARSFSREFGRGESHTLRVRAISTAADADRRISGVGSATGQTADPPKPTITANRTNTVEPCQIGNGSCRRYTPSATNLPPNQTFTARCQFNNGTSTFTDSSVSITLQSNGSGNASSSSWCHVGSGNQLRFRINVNGTNYYSNAGSN